MTPATAEPETVTRHLFAHLADDAEWRDALSRLTDAAPTSRLHLAVMTEPFLSLLLNGSKTIESRFSRVRCAPWRVLQTGDAVVLKKAGGPVSGAFIAGHVDSIELDPADPAQLAAVRTRFAAAICADEEQFWTDRADAKMVTLAAVIRPVALPPLRYPKKDRRGWVVLADVLPARQPVQQELPWLT